jgi:2-polyprenyl-3-methyl-5-hydroxy-6-metoxy-1,4-benzoquinol methylase
MNAPREAAPTPVSVACAACGADVPQSRYPLERGAIVACQACGFSYVSPRLPGDWLQARLQHWAEQDVVDAERLRIAYDPATLQLYDRHLARLEAVCGRPGELLDVGCSTGAFLHAARQREWRGRGIEVGRASADYARSQGLVVETGSLYDFHAIPASFDAIAFLEVIEHLEDPLGALRQIAGWLRPGGALLLSTPNFDSLYRRLFGTRWWVVNCEDEHIQFFNPATLRHALERTGFDVLYAGTRGLDVAGMWRNWRRPASASTTTVEHGAETGYHAARHTKEGIKARLQRLGLLAAVRGGLRGMDGLMSSPMSPVYGLGEQLIFVARRRSEP